MQRLNTIQEEDTSKTLEEQEELKQQEELEQEKEAWVKEFKKIYLLSTLKFFGRGPSDFLSRCAKENLSPADFKAAAISEAKINDVVGSVLSKMTR